YSCPDYVEIYDGTEITAQSLGKFCGTYEPDELPEGVMTSGPRALVKFKSDSSIEKTGFQLAYHDNCGGYHFANGTKQYLATPNYPSYYIAPAYCTWTIQSSIPGEQILLHFDHFDTYFDHTVEGCKNAHYVQIYEGAAPKDVDKHCGISAPSPYRSKGSRVRVLFDATYDSGDNKRSGFTFDYTTEEDRCGGDWSGITGNINYPPSGPVEADCTWNVFQSPGNPVELTLTIGTENNPDCSRNYLSINATFDGISEELIFCDKQQNASVSQWKYETYAIRYISDGTLSSHSFQGILVMNSGTPKPFFSATGQIASPLYPRTYPQRIDATWTLQAKSSRVIRYEITAFDVICTDRFMLINGELGENPQFFDGCGDYLQENPEMAKGVSKENILTLRLVTNSEISGHGFLLNYTHVEGSGEIPVFPDPDPIVQGECGNELVIAGIDWLPFISPGFPNGYDNNLDCFWFFKQRTMLRSCSILKQSKSSEIINVQLPSRGITVDSNGASPQVNDALKVNKLAQLDTQKWMLSDGKLRLIDREINLCIAAHPYEAQLTMQPCDGVGILTDFKQEHTKIGRSLGKFCGTQADLPDKTIKSRTPGVLILHHIQSGHSGSKWNFNWTASPNNCAEELTEDSGTIMSPRYPDPYESNKRCEWSITVNPRNSIIVTFSDFDFKAVDDTFGCLNHYVQIFGGLYIDSPELSDRLCGTALPMPVQSQGNTMKIVFDIGNDAEPNGRGFILDYMGTIAPKTCGSIGPVTLDEPTEISSPGYPNNYTDNSECIWTVQNTWLSGTIYYEVNEIEFEDGCVDKLDFYLVGPYDQPQLTAPQHTLCGKSGSKAFGIPGPVNDIRFVTNQNTNYKGFDMTVSEHLCGGLFGAVGVNWIVGGRISSPNYPENYDSNDYCIWYLVAPEKKILTYSFTTFDLDGATTQSECRDYDWLKVYEGIFQSREKHFWCSTNKPVIGKEMHSTQNMLKFVFKSDNRNERSGFAMEWSFSNNECGSQILQEQEGTIGSPGYFSTPAANYPANMNCVWTINAEKNAHIELVFTDFWLQDMDNDLCLTDYVDVWNGKEINTDKIGQYCGRRLPPPARSNLDHLVLNMISDGNKEYKGFAATYEQVCGTLFVDEYIGYITNIGFGLGSYRPNTDCFWNITMTDKNALIEARFLEFDIEYSPGCSSDYVALYETEKAQENLIRKECGSSRPNGWITARGTMIVNFVTNDKVEKSGFEIQFTVDECGGSYQGKSGSIANWHPDGFAGQHQNLDCIWVLRTEDVNYSVKVTSWIHFVLPVNVNCSSGSYLAAYEEESILESDLIGRYCGKSPPRFLQSKSNQMTLRYKTDAGVASSGFELKWAQTIGSTYGCGGNVKVTTTTTITSPLYPAADYPDNLECVWNIYSDEPSISLKYEIKHFDLEPREGITSVCYDYLEIIDGATFQDRVMFGPECGEIGKQVIKGTHQQNVMIFVSDEVGAASGFEILVTAYNSQCGGELAVSDEWQDINWNYMGDNSHCQWTLKSDSHHFISIQTQTMSLPAPTDEYKLPIELRATANYQVLLDSLAARRVTKIDMTADINKNVLFSLPFFLGLFDDFNQDPRFYINFAVKLTQPDTYETTISNSQYQRLAAVQHTAQDFFDLLDFIELRIEDHYIGVWNKDTGALFIEVDDSIENAFINRKELVTLKVKTQEYPGTFKVTDVAYGVGGTTQVFQLEPLQVVAGKKLGELERMYKTVSVELDVKLDARNDLDTWVNIVQVTLDNGQSNSIPGDRMPLISLQPSSSQFHIAWGLNDNKNYVTITENQPLNKWIHLEISQSKTSTGKYVHDVKVDGRNYAGVVQEQPRDYVDLIVYAASPFGETAHAQIRNFKITTQSKFSFCSFLSFLRRWKLGSVYGRGL
ncbi:unnamed protein product, partial [Oikopleura dioica]